jgi:hypothetical protein
MNALDIIALSEPSPRYAANLKNHAVAVAGMIDGFKMRQDFQRAEISSVQLDIRVARYVD